MKNTSTWIWNPYNPTRRITKEVQIGDTTIGGTHPILVQSMTNTETRDVDATVTQSLELQEAGCELVRVTAPTAKHAESLKEIVKLFHQGGGTIPFCADIHFQPKAAWEALKWVEKVRINPGNFVDQGLQSIDRMNEESFVSGRNKAFETFGPFVQEAARLGRALRIGTNHGSLSGRMLWKYGDTVEGMVESALEYLEICEAENFHNIVFSMKASNPKVVIQAYRMLAERLDKNGWNYPFHVGVTEAGEGLDGRLKSAAGIGALLQDGLGDTIRVSLTESPVAEIPVAQTLLQSISSTANDLKSPSAINEEKWPFSPTAYKRRSSREISVGNLKIGSSNPLAAGCKLADSETSIVASAGRILEFAEGKSLAETVSSWPKIEASELENLTEEGPVEVILRAEDLSDFPKFELNAKKERIWSWRGTKNALVPYRLLASKLHELGLDDPILLYVSGEDSEENRFRSAAWTGSLLCDGIGDLLEVDWPSSYTALDFAYDLLQVTGFRRTRTEFISCPSCGRTLFDLEKVTATIKEKTGHLKDVAIAVMGCIVNGPGEMAGADFGYVGGAPGKVHLYVGQNPVRKNIPEEEATDVLISLIKEHGRWNDPI